MERISYHLAHSLGSFFIRSKKQIPAQQALHCPDQEKKHMQKNHSLKHQALYYNPCDQNCSHKSGNIPLECGELSGDCDPGKVAAA